MHERKSEKLNRYDALFQILILKIPGERLIRDPLRTLAYGTDASFYRLTPKLIVRVQSEDEVAVTIRTCAQLEIPYTFRAAGTSLSGQALSDSVLIKLSRLWNGIYLNGDGTIARLEPAVLGSEANRSLSHNFPVENVAGKEKVVYFPCCVSRLFGASMASPYSDSQNARIERLLRKAGYSVIYPEGLDNLCCGMAFSSKGYLSQATRKMNELVDALSVSSQSGDYPVFIDASPCAQRLKEYQVANPNLRIYDIADFLMDFVAPRVHIKKRPGLVAVHVPCSLRRSAQEKSLVSLAEMCSEKVCIPESVACCGFAGDRGFSNPELIASALVRLPTALPSDCQTGYSSSRTCEIGVSLHSGVSYQSIAYLVDEAVQTVDGS